MGDSFLFRAARRLCGCALAAFLAWPRPAAALDICVQTLADLVNGLHQAQIFQADGTVTLRLVAQTYAWNGSETIVLANRLNILGGYNGNCTARTVDPANTVIDGLGVLELLFYQAGLGMTVEGVRFHQAEFLDVLGTQTCLDYGEEVTWRRTIVDTTAGNFAVGNSCGDLVFQNNLVRARYGTILSLSPIALATDAFIVNNTFIDASDGNGLELFRSPDSETAVFNVSNNILWGSAGQDFTLRAASAVPVVRAYHNIWGTVLMPLDDSAGNLGVDPQLDASGRPIEPSSPAINSGFNTPPGGLPAVDIDGGPRLVGSAVDRGAYESAVVDVTELVVTHSGDSGPGSLRQAILDANTLPDFNTIRFAIPGDFGAFLLPATPYPDIVSPMRIDAFTQPGAQPNANPWSNSATYRISIAGGGTVPYAFRVPTSAGPNVKLELRGFMFGGFTNAVLLQAGTGHVIAGNHFGSFSPGILGGSDNVNGIYVSGTASAVHIGGLDPAERNSISGHESPPAGNGYGIYLGGSGTGHVVANNLIGTYPDGNTAHGHRIGIRVDANLSVLLQNLVSGNETAIDLRGDENLIASNRLGVKTFAFCLPPCVPDTALPNTHGILVAGTANGNGIWQNQIANGTYSGMILFAGTVGNELRANRVYANQTFDVDVRDPAGMNPIDYDGPSFPPGPCDNANCDQNFPELSAAFGGRRSGRVTGVLSSWNGVHRIELFSGSACGPGGQGGARTYLGHRDVEISGATSIPPRNGSVAFDIPIESAASLYGQYITATATSSSGNSSEYSACIAYACDQIFAHDFDSAAAQTCPGP
jgi:hypothetical protein